MQTFSITFLCRTSKMGKNGTSPIEMTVILNGERICLSLPRKIEPSEFNKLFNQKKNNELKEYCELFRQKIYNIQRDLIKYNLPITSQNIKEFFKNGGIKEYDLDTLFKEYTEYLMNFKNSTLENYQKYKIVMDGFYKLVGNKKVEDITKADAHNYLYLLNKSNGNNTIVGKLNRIRSIFNFAVDNRKISYNPFNNIKVKKVDTEVEYLTEEEINKIINTEMITDAHSKVKDLFLFQTSSGLSYSDMLLLTKEDIQVEGETYFINKKRQKTKIEFTSIILPFGIEILKKYDYQLPIISNQKYNQYLKIVQGVCGIKTLLHSHLARKSYATLLLNRGCRIETIAKLLGHSNSRITSKVYAHLKKDTIIKEVNEVINNFNIK